MIFFSEMYVSRFSAKPIKSIVLLRKKILSNAYKLTTDSIVVNSFYLCYVETM